MDPHPAATVPQLESFRLPSCKLEGRLAKMFHLPAWPLSLHVMGQQTGMIYWLRAPRQLHPH